MPVPADVLRFPRHLEQQYADRLVARQRTAQRLLSEQLSWLTRRSDNKADDDERRVRATVAATQRVYELGLEPDEQDLIPTARAVDTYSTRGTVREIERLVGVDVEGDSRIGSRSREEMRALHLGWARENVALIKTVDAETFDDIADHVVESVVRGRTDLEDVLVARFGVARSRAKLIARDQVGKLNAQITQARQEQLGITQYEWSSSGDQRVRPLHRKLDGQIRRWDQPHPTEGHPGHAIACRCVAIPVIDDPEDLDEPDERPKPRPSTPAVPRFEPTPEPPEPPPLPVRLPPPPAPVLPDLPPAPALHLLPEPVAVEPSAPAAPPPAPPPAEPGLPAAPAVELTPAGGGGDLPPVEPPTPPPAPPPEPPRRPEYDLSTAREVEVFEGMDEDERRAAMVQVFGHDVSPSEILSWTGIEQEDLDDAEVYVKKVGFAVEVQIRTDNFEVLRTYKRGLNDEKIAKHNLFEVYKAKKGTGAEMFTRQVERLKRSGFKRIDTDAAGDFDQANTPNGFNGYVTWPKFGYDTELSKKWKAKLPAFLQHATTLLDIYETPGGEDWWYVNGSDIDVEFDLSEGSRSLKVFDKYLEKKGRRPRQDAQDPDTSPAPSRRRVEQPDLDEDDEAALRAAWAELRRPR